MALASPILTVDTTSTEGTGTFTFDDPASPGSGLRTLADAVAAGHAANGQTVEYLVVDTTTEGAALSFEHGIGTIGGGGTTLTRDTPIQTSNSDAFVSWPSGGSRTVRVILAPENVCRTANNLSDVLDADTAADNIGAARKNAANTYTEAQSITKSVAGLLTGLAINNNEAAATTNRAGLNLGARSSAQLRAALSLRGLFSVTTDASLESTVEFLTWVGGSNGIACKIVGQSLQTGSGNKYDAFPTGMDLLSSVVPTGWTRSDSSQSRLIRLAKSGETLGSEAGADDIFDGAWATLGHILTVSQLAEHAHVVFHGLGIADANGDGSTIATGRVQAATAGDDQVTESAGDDAAHTHNMTTPYYRIVARIVKS